jgi:hypothetical protein
MIPVAAYGIVGLLITIVVIVLVVYLIIVLLNALRGGA